MVGTFISLLLFRHTRLDALIILVTNIAVFFSMTWLFQKLGYVRLLGIIHVIFWIPLAIYLFKRLQNRLITAPIRQIIWLFLAMMAVSLVFDIADVARYVAGERESLALSQ